MNKKEANTAFNVLREFISQSQLTIIAGNACQSDEKQFFHNKLIELADVISNMPETYGQDGKGDQAVAYLHYFKGCADWYITEKDCDPDGEGQIQAFGLADLGYGGELGYISITELIANDIEIDLYFTPCTLESIKRAA